jgi:Arc/MetJ family transcription regulator
MLRARGKASVHKTTNLSSQTRTNIHIDTNLVRRITSHTRLKSRRAVVDFALRTTAELLDKRERVAKATDSVFGLTRDTDIFPDKYASSIRGK